MRLLFQHAIQQGETLSWREGLELDGVAQSMASWSCSITVRKKGEISPSLIQRAVSDLTSDGMQFIILLTAAETSTLPVGECTVIVTLSDGANITSMESNPLFVERGNN